MVGAREQVRLKEKEVERDWVVSGLNRVDVTWVSVTVAWLASLPP